MDWGIPPDLVEEYPPRTLEVGQDFPLDLDVVYGVNPCFAVRISWLDKRGPQEKLMSMSL